MCISDQRVIGLYRMRVRAAQACDNDMKRPLLIIAVCLLAGAVVNVAVAWGCGIASEPNAHACK